MSLLTEEELNEINGGGQTLWLIIGGGISFVLGVISGWFNPKACNK